MSPFHSGMNHWQRQWLSDRLHRKPQTSPSNSYSPPAPLQKREPVEKPKPDPDIARVSRLKPNAEKALRWLERASCKDDPELFRALLAWIPIDQINNTSRASSSVLESVIARSWGTRGDEDRLKCIELLLGAGARWNPPTEQIRGIRRTIMTHEVRYIGRLIRLLHETPNAVAPDQFLELCRSNTLEIKLGMADRELLEAIRALRKTLASGNSSLVTPSAQAQLDQEQRSQGDSTLPSDSAP